MRTQSQPNLHSTQRHICKPSYRYNTTATCLLGQELLKRSLFNNDVTHRPELLAALLLLLKQFPPSCNVAGMQLRQHIFSERLDGLTGDDASASSSLDDDLCDCLLVIHQQNALQKGNAPNICRSTCSLNLVTHCLPSRMTWLLCTMRAIASTAFLFTNRFILTRSLSRQPASS